MRFPKPLDDGQSELAREASSLPRHFLYSLDNFIKGHSRELTCDDVYRMYYHLFYSLRTLRCNSENFVGYSELLVFRVVWHVLGGAFIVDPMHSDIEWPLEFIGIDDAGVRLAQGTTWRNRQKPDIRIEVDNKLVSVVEVKVYPSVDDVADEVQRLVGFHAEEPDLRALLLIYSFREPQRSAELLREAQASHGDYLSSVVLHEKREPLARVLGDSLGLDRLAARGWPQALG